MASGYGLNGGMSLSSTSLARPLSLDALHLDRLSPGAKQCDMLG